VVHTGAAQAGAPHPPEDPVDGCLVDIADPAPADLGGEPPQVQAPVVLHGARLAALLAQQVLGQELLDRLVYRHVTVLSAAWERVTANLGDEGRKLPGRLGFGVGLHGAMQPAHPPVGVATGRDRELPHARADLGLRSRAPWSAPPIGRRRLATQGEVLDPHARRVVRAGLDDDTDSERAARQQV
jgi:hypothetical protein